MKTFFKTSWMLMGIVLATATLAAVTIAYTLQRMNAVETLIARNVEDILTAADLNSALLTQSGLMAAYIAEDGDPRRLEEIERLEPFIRARLDQARKSYRTDNRREALVSASEAFEAYAGLRREIVELHESGRTDEAKQAFLQNLSGLHRLAAARFADVMAVNRTEIEETLRRSERAYDSAVIVMVAGALGSVVLAGTLLWLLMNRVFRPLDRMARHLDAGVDEAGEALRMGELDSLEYYWRTLASQLAEGRKRPSLDRQSERMVAVGNAVAHIAHEIRNRLAVVGGFANIISRQCDSAPARKSAGIIHQETQRMEEMLRNVVEFSEPAPMKRKRVALNALVEEVAGRSVAGLPEGASIEIEVDPRIGEVSLDRARVELLLTNLIRNAADAAGRGGIIRVMTESAAQGAALIVQDNGPGVPEDLRERLFEPFFTTKPKGGGLGLAICLRIAEEHGGAMEVDLAEGGGARFVARFPGETPGTRP